MMNNTTLFLLASLLLLQTSTAITLPPRLQDSITKGLLSQPRNDIYVLGTVHIGSTSAYEAQELIRTLKPSTVVIEIPPSRLARIRRRRREANAKKEEGLSQKSEESSTPTTPPKNTDLMSAFVSLPALASAGWNRGGLSGFLFSTVIVWSSMLKRSTTVSEEDDTLPRWNEFEAAIEAAEEEGANILPADLEFEDLIRAAARSMSPLGWIQLGIAVVNESIGLRQADPVRRVAGESMVEWEERRRDIRTARASRDHGERAFPELSRVLVDSRDARFAQMCLDAIERNGTSFGDGRCDDVTVCIVGLVHLDGVVRILNNNLSTERG